MGLPVHMPVDISIRDMKVAAEVIPPLTQSDCAAERGKCCRFCSMP